MRKNNKLCFTVIKLNEAIKTIIFAVLGVAIIIVLLKTFLPSNSEKRFNAGTYTTSISINEESAVVSLTVNDTEITDVSLTPTSETLAVFYPLIEKTSDEICKQTLQKQTTDGIVSESGGEETTKLIVKAINATIERATYK